MIESGGTQIVGMNGKRPRLKYVFLGCGTVLIVGLAIVTWFVLSLFSEPDMTEMPAHHPFKSTKAKDNYLKYYKERSEKWPVASETRMVETSQGETFVRISGPGDAPPLVLLASGGATSLFWIPNVETLSEHFRVYAIDNIYDFGLSVHTRAFRSSDDLMDWLDELFDALGLGNDINLMGLSYGGWLTSLYALHSPERLRRIVLIAPAATIFDLPGEWAWRGILSAIPSKYIMKRVMVNWLFEDLIKNGEEADQVLVDEYITDAMMALRCFKFKMPIPPTVLTDDELRSIEVPALFLVGENEKIYPSQQALDRLHAVAPRIHAEIIPGAGHDLTIIQAELVNGKVVDFIKRPEM
jgi:pimeloyl-ACP methyl ester carboxylesterase